MKTVVTLLLLGLPLALFFAWTFEMTPDGIKREEDVDRSQPGRTSARRTLDYVIIAALLIALGYTWWSRQPVEAPGSPSTQADVSEEDELEQKSPDHRSIAVLPFVNMSSDQAQEWFSDGLTEEILNALARTPDLLVAARTSSFKYKNSDEDVPTIAAALGVAHILEGSVRSSRDRLRVTAQLIQASDLPIQTRTLALLRQACAEGNLKEAERNYDIMMAEHSDDLSMNWISNKIFGRDEVAQQLLEPYDENMELDILMDFATYHYFDPTPFPNLVQYLKSQGVEPRKPLEMTYQCRT